MKTVEYCDAVKGAMGIESHYALAKGLGISKQAITRLYGGGVFSPETAVKVAAILHLDPLIVIADCEMERAKAPAMRAVWERIAARAAAAVVVGIGIGGILAGAIPADPALPLQSVADSGTLYIMLNDILR